RGCWYHASLPTDRRKRPRGRFDLAAPDGTCYLAETEGVAARERCGRFIIKNMPVPPEWFEGRVVSKFAVPPPDGPVGDLTNTAVATSGVTAEIHTISDYRLTTVGRLPLDVADTEPCSTSPGSPRAVSRP
ncbi:MAG: hypothetical protein ACJ72A_03685, partial [Nocardioidaceae bacterium]